MTDLTVFYEHANLSDFPSFNRKITVSDRFKVQSLSKNVPYRELVFETTKNCYPIEFYEI